MKEKLLLCTDLDRTLIPNGTQPESPAARDTFALLATRAGIHLVYVTGRHKTLVQQAIKCYSLPEPDFVISDVGTRMYDLRNGDWQVWQDWEAEIAADWAGRSQTGLQTLFTDLPALQLQETEKQNTHKLSYYVSLHEDSEALINTMQQRLQKLGVHASLTWSIDEPAGLGLLDVLPGNATKLHAIEFLRERLGYTRSETLFAGDSGNDLPVFISPVPAIVVANTAHEVSDAARKGAEQAGHRDKLYFANGGFLGMNGNYSAGILEGVAHFKPGLGSWLAEQKGASHAG